MEERYDLGLDEIYGDVEEKEKDYEVEVTVKLRRKVKLECVRPSELESKVYDVIEQGVMDAWDDFSYYDWDYEIIKEEVND